MNVPEVRVNPNDLIRDAILRQLYAIHTNAKSPKSAGAKIRDLQKTLKGQGYKQQEVASNLDYLIQKGWAVENVANRTFTTPAGTTQVSEVRTYKISDTGIDRLEAASIYERPRTEHAINVTTINGVTVVGDGNVVNTNYTDLSRVLSGIRTHVLESAALPDAEKLNVAADIDAVQSQLAKPEPNKDVIKALWSGIQASVTAAEFVDLIQKASDLLGPLIS